MTKTIAFDSICHTVTPFNAMLHLIGTVTLYINSVLILNAYVFVLVLHIIHWNRPIMLEIQNVGWAEEYLFGIVFFIWLGIIFRALLTSRCYYWNHHNFSSATILYLFLDTMLSSSGSNRQADWLIQWIHS